MREFIGGLLIVAMLSVFIIGIVVPWSCEHPADVARCVERCESLPNGCKYDETHGDVHNDSRYCVCKCDWKLPLTPLDAGVER